MRHTIGDQCHEEEENIIPEKAFDPYNLHPIEISYETFPLDFLRPVPHEIPMNDGPTWLNPGGIAEVGWDFEMCQENDPLIIAKELLQ